MLFRKLLRNMHVYYFTVHYVKKGVEPAMSEPKTRETNIERRLQDLLAYPRESLDTELKSWLDLSKETDKANLAQAMIAISNHGGGYIIIGFAESSGQWIPSEPRPANLDIYNQDIVNGIVQAYAERLQAA